MGGKFGVVVLFFLLGLNCSCDARNPILLEPFGHENQVCELCDKYVTLAIDYLQDDDNHQGNCEACRDTVSELVTKLKDPQTKLKIIRLPLKECKSLKNYQDKCKKMVFEYGPLMFADLDEFLEKKDVCSILGVCPGPGLGLGPGPATHRVYVSPLRAVAGS